MMRPPIIRQSPLTNEWYYSRSYVEEKTPNGKSIFRLKSKVNVTSQITAIIADVLKQEESKRRPHVPGCTDCYCPGCSK